MPVEGERRIGFVGLENFVDCELRGFEFRERAFDERGRETRRQQQRVLVSQRNLKMLCQTQNHIPARLRAPGFEVREVAGRAVRRQGQAYASGVALVGALYYAVQAAHSARWAILASLTALAMAIAVTAVLLHALDSVGPR
jgi:hypothetical protein